MDQLKQLIAGLTLKQRVTIAVMAMGVVTALVLLTRWNHERDFRPLYTGLSQEDAGAVLAKVRESGTEYRVGEGGSSLLVPSSRVAELRLQLASAGIPKAGRIGFELFDKTSFGASDFTEQINYHRALEGELERSVMSLAEVEQARVHVTFPKDSIFLESRQPAKASVLVKLRPGAALSAQNVMAICQLTSSAVLGLQPEAVAVVDMRGNLLSRPRHAAADVGEPSEAALDYRRQIERDLLAKINGTLEPVLGPDRFRAGVSVECDFTSGEQSEETFDPTKSVMLTSQRTEDIAGGTQAAGVPGTASNLPRPTSRPGMGSNGVTRRTENISYQASRVVRHVKLPQGTVKKLSVSVLVDSVRWVGSGAQAKRLVEAPPPERLKAIHDLVAGVIGISAERGDQFVIEALPFETAAPAEMPAPSATPTQVPGNRLVELVKNPAVLMGAGAALLIVLLGGGVALLFRNGKRKARVQLPPEIQSPGAARNSLETSEKMKSQMEAQIAEQAALKRQQEVEALNALKMPRVTTKKAEVLSKHIAEEARKDATSMVQVLRNWMNEVER